MNSRCILERISGWSRSRWHVTSLVVFGSQVAVLGSSRKSDGLSDVDLQIVTWRPSLFLGPEWTSIFGEHVSLYVTRNASGGVFKATALWSNGAALDVIVVSSWQMWFARIVVAFGLHRRSQLISSALSELATVLRGGYSVLKGGVLWARFYNTVVEEVVGDRISDARICRMADEFVCDCVWVRQKIARGEFIAARRTMVRSLWECNVKLLYELMKRQGREAWRDARRIEGLAQGDEVKLVDLNALRGAISDDLLALEDSFRVLVHRLVGLRWQWPKELTNEGVGNS